LAIGGTAAVVTGLNAHPESRSVPRRKVAEPARPPFSSHGNKICRSLGAMNEIVFGTAGQETRPLRS